MPAGSGLRLRGSKLLIIVERRKDIGPLITLVQEGPSDSATSEHALK